MYCSSLTPTQSKGIHELFFSSTLQFCSNTSRGERRDYPSRMKSDIVKLSITCYSQTYKYFISENSGFKYCFACRVFVFPNCKRRSND